MRYKKFWYLISILLLGLTFSLNLVAQDATATPEEEATVEATTSEDEASTPEPSETETATEESASEATSEPTPDAPADLSPSTGPLDTIPIEIANHTEDWPLPHKDYRNTRASLTSNINSETVDQLEVAWTFAIPGRASFGAAASAPIISSGVVYFQDLESNVFAIDLLTGQVLWRKMYGNAVIGPNGPGIGYDKVFVISGVDSFSALDIETGTEIWTVDTGELPTGAFQPSVYGGYVYFTTQAGVGGEGDTSFRGYAGGTSGHIMALDPNTGEIVWDFQTVEEGYWGNPELNSGGGVWFSPAIDTESQLTFWGTGNPAPFPGTFDFPNAGSREEPNLYTNSIIALAHDTGEMIWYNYVNPNDLFDLDFQASPMLATIPFEGQQRNIVIGSGKLGEVVAFDRETGETIWRTPVGIHQNDDLTEIPPDETVVVYPGILGGVETPMAYADGVVYAPVLNLPTEHSPTGWGGETGTEALEGANAHTPIGQGSSELVALDATNGQVLWSHEFGSDMYGGATVVSDLVFVATYDGMIYALNRASGETEWSYQAPAGINSWPAVADDTIVWSAGTGDNPMVIALRLPFDETSGMAETPAPESTAETQPPEGEEGTPTEGTPAEGTPEATPEGTPEATPEGGGDGSGESGSTEFISVDEENQTVTLTVIAAYDDTNGGLNFNGYANGDATYIVPQGWTVNVEFENRSDLPHSALVVPQDAVEQTEMPDPVFQGAAISDPSGGTTSTGSFSFTAEEQGTYAMACGVPGHASDGQWIVFEVGGSDAQPAFETGGS